MADEKKMTKEEIENELNALLNDPLLSDEIDYRRNELFNMPSDMQKVIDKREAADHVASNKPCEDFEKYKHLFAQVHADLKSGRRSLVPVKKGESFVKDHFYLISGVIYYIAEVGDKFEHDYGNKDFRTRCILETGMETDLLVRSLYKAIAADGYGITEPTDRELVISNDNITADDVPTGYVYVLSSLSTNPAISSIADLYKIGVTTTTVEERIANAKNEPTYLCAPVKIVDTYKVYNVNPQKVETFLHAFFASTQLKLSVEENNILIHNPKEWFIVPREVIQAVVEKIMADEDSLANYRYNPDQKCLERIIKSTKSKFDTEGMKVLRLNIKKIYLDEIISGQKKIEYRILKNTTIDKYTTLDKTDNKRYLRPYDVISFTLMSTKKETALVEITGITFDAQNNTVEYHLGRILEHLVQ